MNGLIYGALFAYLSSRFHCLGYELPITIKNAYGISLAVLGFNHAFLTEPESGQYILNDFRGTTSIDSEATSGSLPNNGLSKLFDIANYADDCTLYVSVDNFHGFKYYL